MNFVEAVEQLKCCINDDQIAAAIGVSTNTVRRTRADPNTRNYRPPPEGWQEILARLARERGADLIRLADALDRE